jgi:MFS family permease
MTGPASAPVAPTGSPAGGNDVTAAGRGRARRVVAALAITQTVGYGALYYSFAVFLTPLARDLHTSTTAVTAALTIATLTGGAVAVPVGAWLDRHGGRALMSLGSLAGTALLALMSTVDSLVGLYAVWLGIGLASAMVLYEAAFAVVITWHPTPRARANGLLAITVVAGFASTIFLPLTGALVQAYGWRTAALILAAIHGALTIPLHAAVLRRAPAYPKRQLSLEQAHDPNTRRRTAVRTALHDSRFWLLALAFVTHAAALAALSVHLVAYLIQAGHPATFAATVTGLLGILSVTGRVVTTGLQRHIRATRVVAAVFAVQALAAAALPLIGHDRTGAVIGVIGFGLGFGVATIARPSMLTARYGTTGYATISGILTVPMTVAKAGAPLAAAVLYGLSGGYTPVLASVALACAIAATAVLAVGSPNLAEGQPAHCHEPRVDLDNQDAAEESGHAASGRRRCLVEGREIEDD